MIGCPPIPIDYEELRQLFHDFFRENGLKWENGKLVGIPFMNIFPKRIERHIFGEKVFIVNLDTLQYGLIKEDHKVLDMVGGKMEEGEIAGDTIVREIFEEIGIRKERDSLMRIGTTIDETGCFHTNMYLWCCYDVNIPGNLEWYDIYSPIPIGVQWLPRLVIWALSHLTPDVYVQLSRRRGKSFQFPKINGVSYDHEGNLRSSLKLEYLLCYYGKDNFLAKRGIHYYFRGHCGWQDNSIQMKKQRKNAVT